MVSKKKIETVEKLCKLAKEHSTIGIIDMFKIPTKEFKEMKKRIGGIVIYAKKRLAKLALEKAGKQNLEKLIEYFPNQLALIFSNKDCFQLYAEISKLKQKTFAKGGEIAEEDIVLRAGPTPLPAGPAIGEFAKLKIPAGVEQGRIAIKKDTVVVKKGQTISAGVASLLKKLNIPSITIKLPVIVFWQNGQIFGKEALSVVEQAEQLIKQAYQQALNLSINISYPTKDNIKILLTKAYLQAKSLEAKIGG